MKQGMIKTIYCSLFVVGVISIILAIVAYWFIFIGSFFIICSIPFILKDMKLNQEQHLREVIKFKNEVLFDGASDEEEKLRILQSMRVARWLVWIFKK